MDDERKKPFKPGRKPTGDRKPFGERPARDGDKPFRKPRPAAAGPGEKRAYGDKKPFKPRGDGPEGGRPGPSSDRSEGSKPRPRAVVAENAVDGERIAKRLARAGISSRRDAEALIADGRIRVNGVVLATPARNVTADDRIELDGKPIPEIERTRLFLFHKPAGVVTTNRDPEGRRTVFDVLPAELPRLLTVGRLDINTEGLLLLTNDGGLARVLELPATGWLRRYRVRVHGAVDEAKLAELKDGVAVEGTFYGSIEATLDRAQGSNAWLSIGLREGKNREVKNVLGALGLEVTRLIRLSFGPFQLGELAEGAVHELKGRYLRDQLGDRLIAESGAVFDLPDRKPEAKPEAEAERAPEPLHNKRREREDRRSDALDRLDTKPRFGKSGDKPGFKAGGFAKPRGEKRGEKRGDQPKREPIPARSRGANVWMAPGARPMGQKKAEADAEAVTRRGTDERKQTFGDRKPRPDGGKRDFAKPAGEQKRSFKPRGEAPSGERPAGRPADRPTGRSFAKPAGKPTFKAKGDAPRRDRPPRSDKPRSGPGGGGRPPGGAPRGKPKSRT